MNSKHFLFSAMVLSCLTAATAVAENASEKAPSLATKLPAKKTQSVEKITEPDIPHPAQSNPYAAELHEIRKTMDAEREAVLNQEVISRDQAELERQTAARNSKIESLKARQERINADMKAMQTELADYRAKYETVQGKYTDAELKHEDFAATLEKERADLEALKSKYEGALAQLNQRHDRTAKSVNTNLVAIHKLKSELATVTTNVDVVETQMASVQADDAKSKAEWMELKSQIEDKKGEKVKRFAALTDAEARYRQALSAQKSAQVELVAMEKSLSDVTNRVTADVRKFDESTLAAQRAKIIADTGKMRAEAEIDKMKNYLAMVKKSNAEVVMTQTNSETNLMTTQLALEAAKSELAITVAAGDQLTLRKSKQAAEMRSIASIETADAVLAGGRTWVTKTSCQLREHPRTASASVGEAVPGEKIAATVGPGSWIKILSKGRTAYVRTECGSFE